MERKIANYLLAWKNSPNRMPLLLYGARQVGKTYTALTFGKEHYRNTVYFNLEDSGEIAAISNGIWTPIGSCGSLRPGPGSLSLRGIPF